VHPHYSPMICAIPPLRRAVPESRADTQADRILWITVAHRSDRTFEAIDSRSAEADNSSTSVGSES
jgi:hypothetical protein